MCDGRLQKYNYFLYCAILFVLFQINEVEYYVFFSQYISGTDSLLSVLLCTYQENYWKENHPVSLIFQPAKRKSTDGSDSASTSKKKKVAMEFDGFLVTQNDSNSESSDIEAEAKSGAKNAGES